ncbi:MAG: hypothetical protein L6Q71_10575 [Planctomycetes bacterium]|nr:hypothetical protein [Planctomycetota bacterium]
MAEKLGAPSSVVVNSQAEKADQITIRVKGDLDINAPAFLDVLMQAFESKAR